MHKKILMTIMSLIPILLFGGDMARVEAGNVRIAVLISYQRAPFDETLEGFKQYLRKQGISADYDVYSLEAYNEKVAQTLLKVKKDKPDLIFALGSLGTEAALKEIVDIPIIAGMILRSDPLKKTSNGTGVFLEFPVETQLKWLQRFLPDTRTLGVIYNPRENRERIESAVRISQKMTLKIEAREVHAPEDLPYALNDLSKNIDVLWGVADNLVLNPQTAKHILLFSFRNLIPFTGLSSSWVKAGALYSLESDYMDNGMQCGEMAFRVLHGTNVNSIKPVPPRKIIYSLNLNTVKHMKIKISEKLIREAYLTY
jgi:putative tryptophan/tyrosine transport system substrate-binding protein